MSIAYQARALGVAGAAFSRQVAREASHVAITYRTRDAAEAVTLESAYFGGRDERRGGDAGMHEGMPNAELCVLRSELAEVTVGATVAQGAATWKVESFRHAPGGVEWVISLMKSS